MVSIDFCACNRVTLVIKFEKRRKIARANFQLCNDFWEANAIRLSREFLFMIRFSWFFLQTSEDAIEIIFGVKSIAKPPSKNEHVMELWVLGVTYGWKLTKKIVKT